MIHTRGNVFQSDWWFDAACPGAWDKVEIKKDNILVASMPFRVGKRLGMKTVTMAPCAHTLEPLFYYNYDKSVTNFQHDYKNVAAIMAALPKHDIFKIRTSPDFRAVQQMALHKLNCTYEYTFRSTVHDHWKNMEQKTRNVIQTASGMFQIIQHTDFDLYESLSRSDRQGYDKSQYKVISRIFEAGVANQSARILSCVDENMKNKATCITVCDDRYLYYWLSARSRESNCGHSNSFLIWKTFELARTLGLEFDIDGYNPYNADGLFKAKFGFAPAGRALVRNSSRIFHLGRALFPDD